MAQNRAPRRAVESLFEKIRQHYPAALLEPRAGAQQSQPERRDSHLAAEINQVARRRARALEKTALALAEQGQNHLHVRRARQIAAGELEAGAPRGAQKPGKKRGGRSRPAR